MKSPLRKFRGFGLHHGHRERRDHRPPPAKLDELVYAAQEMEEMRNCYDSLLSTAAATTNSVYEFAEAMEEMGTCLLEKTALNYDDDDSGRLLMMLGKAQFELQKFVDNYRTNIINTITNPSESLLKELQVVEEMKDDCDQKRKEYEAMQSAYREKGRSRHSKTETLSSNQLQASFLEYQGNATLFIFRLKSLKQGQSLSILTQAARHHAAQLSFFRRGLKFLEAIEPHVKAVAEKHHIDCDFGGLDDDTDNDDYSSYQDNHSDGSELSFDYEINDRDKDFPASRSSMDSDGAYESYPFYNASLLSGDTVVAPPPPAPASVDTVVAPPSPAPASVGTVIPLSNRTNITAPISGGPSPAAPPEDGKDHPNPEEDEDEDSTSCQRYSYKILEAATCNFSNRNRLGSGGFGAVYRGTLENEKEVAVKRLEDSKRSLVELEREVSTMAKLRHQNLVRFLGHCFEDEGRLLVYEYLPNNSLDKFWNKENSKRLDWATRFSIIEGVARGLQFLHDKGIIHRDLKPHNVLLDENFNPKIADFDLVRVYNKDRTHESTQKVAGTFGYMAPECTSGAKYQFSIKSDVYSYGVLVLEIVTGRKINTFEGHNSEGLVEYVWQHWTERRACDVVDSDLDVEAAEQGQRQVLRCVHVALLCVQSDRSRRPTMGEVIAMVSAHQDPELPAPALPGYLHPKSALGRALRPLPCFGCN